MRHAFALLLAALLLTLTGSAAAQDKKCVEPAPLTKKTATSPEAAPQGAAARWARDGAGQWRLTSEPR